MAPYRIAGLAVALGIGSAVVAGHGVASADTSDGSTTAGAETAGSSASTHADKETKETKKPSEKPDVEKPDSASTSDADVKTKPKHKPKKDSKGTRSTGTVADPVKPKPATDAPIRAKTPVTKPAVKADIAGAPEKSEAAVDTSPSPTIETAAVTTPTPATVTKPQDPIHLVTVAVAKAFDELLHPTADGAPTSPVQAPAMWTLAAAARRESLTPSVGLAKTADVASPSISEPVVAIPQTPPLAFLQHLPVIGPLAIAPIVAIVHDIPFVGDILHPFIGYPLGSSGARDVKIVSADGALIYVHFMPASHMGADGKAPTILDGPGLGLPGSTNINGTPLDDILTDTVGLIGVGTLRHQGYNVVTWDPRGEWNSGGTLQLNGAEFEGKDISAIISWVADQPEARLDGPGDPRLGMVGVSYGGGIQVVAAANDHRIDAIVPAIAYHSLVSSLYTNGAFKSAWDTPLTAVLLLELSRFNPRILPAAIYGDLTGTLTPEDLALLEDRSPDVSTITAPTLLIQGTADTLFSLQEADTTAQILMANGVPTSVVWFCGGHGVCLHNPLDPTDGQVIKKATLAWLDHYVMGLPESTGPKFQWVDQRGQWYSSDTYPATPGTGIVTSSSDERTLSLVPYLGGSGFPLVPLAFKAPYALNLKVPSATTTAYVVGAPKLSFTYSGTGTSTHVYAQLVDDSTGLVLSNLVTPIPVTLDGQTHTIDDFALEPVSYTMRPGATVTLQLVGAAGLFQTILPTSGELHVSNMNLTLPTADPASVTPM
jgi:ABC-2 type transport system ATP-binding protein